ncbi:putative bifunctional diguanylate cyclase/phosphodiesterase [Thalassotalea hakodatensis]|uniref:putative bifunctional diguanylate cyclase/phosphodiesterase n=1 Tax=Thalassotalea hakodatensis TaxID=3030492 RepID=UPI002572EFAF|nr:GGDEF domain-containing phosphodiesterase [Thalassotalea hakodatensis]
MPESTYTVGFLYTFQMCTSFVLAFFLYEYFKDVDKGFVKYWGLAFTGLAVKYLALACQNFTPHIADTAWLKVIIAFITQIGAYTFALFFILGFLAALKKSPIIFKHQCWLLGLVLTFSLATSFVFAFDVNAAFNRFYIRISLLDFILSGVFLAVAILLMNSQKRFLAAKVMVVICLLFSARYLICSFLTVVMLRENNFAQIELIFRYFDFACYTLLGVNLMIWMQGAERSAAEVAINRAKYMGKHDLLTGALNREQVIENIPLAISTATDKNLKLAIYLIDLKRFKFINDTYGLKIGDLVLGKVAKRLKQSVLLPQVIGRISGDSFVFAIEIGDEGQLEKAAQHLHDVISRAYRVNNQEIHLQASVGYCLAPSDGDEAENLLHKANLALFRAENKNIPSLRYSAGMQADGSHLPAAEKAIRLGIQRKQFVLYFQPQLNLVSNRIEGVEALVRWQHPEKGLLQPDSFLPDFEALGLNSVLDGYVLELACQKLANWYQSFKRRLTIAVNVSAAEFQDPALVSKIQGLLVKYQVPSKYLELEITENVVITDIESAMDTIVTLQNMGIKVSIDDFGTGYSSLSYLRDLPIDKIKIDRSFITDFARNDSDLTIVKSMIKLSHGLGKRVLAEGVENQDQLALLRKLGCDAVQGFYINRPLTEEKLVSQFSRRE